MIDRIVPAISNKTRSLHDRERERERAEVEERERETKLNLKRRATESWIGRNQPRERMNAILWNVRKIAMQRFSDTYTYR